MTNWILSPFRRPVGAALLVGIPLLGFSVVAAASLLQPPISHWAATAEPVRPAPIRVVPAKTPTAVVTPAAPSIAVAPPLPSAPPPPPPENAVTRLFAFQANATAPGKFQPLSGKEAIASYRAWMRSVQTTSMSPSPQSSSVNTIPSPGGMSTSSAYGN
jgi:hypothetical protein